MNIELHRITIRDLVAGYTDDPELGVHAYSGKLDVRPAYQREFVYKERERNAVISTVMKGFPLNVMYWVKKEDGTFEVMDGQQRTISICQYANGDFSWGEVGAVDGLGSKFFHRQPSDIQEKFLDYELMVYFCEGTQSEKIDWFKVINIAGLKLTAQEMRNAVYSGPWVSDAKRYFSKAGCVASKIGSKYLNGSADRQEYLETAISWLVDSSKDKAIEDYMAIHQGDSEAVELWLHFQKVVNWVDTLFPKYRKEMKGLDWGAFWHQYGNKSFNPAELEKEVASLYSDREVESKKGIYEYLLSGKIRAEKLSLRTFDDVDKRAQYDIQLGVCPVCKGHFEYEEMEGDHIVPWSKGGKTTPDNLQMLCRRCNAIKSDKW